MGSINVVIDYKLTATHRESKKYTLIITVFLTNPTSTIYHIVRTYKMKLADFVFRH